MTRANLAAIGRRLWCLFIGHTWTETTTGNLNDIGPHGIVWTRVRHCECCGDRQRQYDRAAHVSGWEAAPPDINERQVW